MNAGQIVPVRDAADMQRALRERAHAAGATYETIGQEAGFADGYVAKLFCDPPIKGISIASMFTLANTLGCVVALIEDEGLARRIKRGNKDHLQRRRARHWRKRSLLDRLEHHWRELGRKGGRRSAEGRMSKLTPGQRSRIARKAAKARWHRRRAERAASGGEQ